MVLCEPVVSTIVDLTHLWLGRLVSAMITELWSKAVVPSLWHQVPVLL